VISARFVLLEYRKGELNLILRLIDGLVNLRSIHLQRTLSDQQAWNNGNGSTGYIPQSAILSVTK